MTNFIRQNHRNYLNQMEEIADTVFRKTRRFLPHVSRICLTLTFIEDSYRLMTQWSEQVGYLQSFWSYLSFLVPVFILINILGQLIGSGMAIFRYRVKLGVVILMGTVLSQTIGYGITNRIFIMRNMALLGGLVLLLAEANEKVKSSLAGLPETGINQPKQYMLLCGRILTLLVFITIIRWGGSFFYIVWAIVNLGLIIMVVVGYKTKLCAFILVIFLILNNFIYNNFWFYTQNGVIWDILKYDFFQTWSVIGGLLMVVTYGPGGVSIDDYKKDW